MHKPESVLENATPKILRDFEKQTAHTIPVRRPDFVLRKKKNFLNWGFYGTSWSQIEMKGSEKIETYLDLVRAVKSCEIWMWH